MNTFVEGIDPTSTFGGYASVLLQLIREATPANTRGIVIFDSTTPDTATYPWMKQSVWVDSSTLQMYVFDEDSTTWVSAFNPAAGSLSGAALTNATVPIGKFSISGGAARSLVRINASNTAWEFVTPANLFNAGEIALAKLAAGGTSGFVLTWNGTTWVAAAPTASTTADGSITPAKLTNPGTASIAWFMTADTAGARSWRAFDPGTDIAVGGLPIAQIAPSGTDNQVLSTLAGVPAWAPPSTAFADGAIPVTKVAPVSGMAADRLLGWNGATWADYPVYHNADASSGTVDAWVANNYFDFTTSFTEPQDLAQVYLVCTTDDAATGFKAGDRLSLQSYRVVGDTKKAALWFDTFMSGGNLKVRIQADVLADFTNGVVRVAGGGSYHTITKSCWIFELITNSIV